MGENEVNDLQEKKSSVPQYVEDAKKALNGEKLSEESLKNIKRYFLMRFKKAKSNKRDKVFLDKMKELYDISEEQFYKIIYVAMSVHKKNIAIHIENVKKIREWMRINDSKRPPRIQNSKKTIPEEEAILGESLKIIKNEYVDKFLALKTEQERKVYLESKKMEEGITAEQFKELITIIQEIKQNAVSQYVQNAEDIYNWIKKNEYKKVPRETGDEEEEKLATQFQTIIRDLIRPYKNYCRIQNEEKFFEKINNNSNISKEQFEQILHIVNVFYEISDYSKAYYFFRIKDIKKWMEDNKTTNPPQCKSDKASDEEKKLGIAWKNINIKLIEPFRKLETEEDKKIFFKRIKNLHHITMEQFNQIMEIVDEINKNSINNSLIMEDR